MSKVKHMNWNTVHHYLNPLRVAGLRIYGVPRGGMILAGLCHPAKSVTSPEDSDFILDDIIDTGETQLKYAKQYPKIPFISLISKVYPPPVYTLPNGFNYHPYQMEDNKWVQFPWEDESSPEDAVIRLLSYIGEDSRREGLKETPKRVTKALREMCRGYDEDPVSIFTVFDKDKYDQMIVLENIEFSSLCEHHMLPFIGTATVGYIPREKIVGISKLARLVEIFAKRLQVQERLTQQIAEALNSGLTPLGCGVVIKAHHMCMSCRGVKKNNTQLTTSCLKGAFYNDSQARNEFLRFVS